MLKPHFAKQVQICAKLRYFRGSHFSQCCYYQQLSIARYQVSFHVFMLTIILSNFYPEILSCNIPFQIMFERLWTSFRRCVALL